MRLQYTVGVRLPNPATAELWLRWLRDGHVADVMAGGATSAQVHRLDGDDNAFEVLYEFPSREAFAVYERDYAPRLRAEGLTLFPTESGVVYRRGTAEIIDTWRPT